LFTAHALTAIGSSFLASVVEVTEAYTIVLAVGLTRGWRPALIGLIAGLALLCIAVLLLGPILSSIPLATLQLPIGLLLLLFGMGWLRKAVLRAAGIIPLHDETLIFEKETQALRGGRDSGAILTAFQGVLLEGLEVIFIVIAVGGTGNLLIPASVGAALACVLVLAAGAILHRPLSRVPENSLKFVVGVMLTSFGVFWIGEALDAHWPGADFALVYIAAIFLVSGLMMAYYLRRMAHETAA
jgi:uncharacterized membrane protein